MSEILCRLLEDIMLIVVSMTIFIVLFIVGLFIFSYFLIISAIIGLILFIVTFIDHTRGQKNPPIGKIIEHNER